MLGVEVSAAQTVLNGQAAVAVAQVVELGAKDHRLRGVAGAGQRVVKFAIFPIPFVAQSLSVTLRAPSQPMGGGNDLPLQRLSPPEIAARRAMPSTHARVLVMSSRFAVETGATRKPR